MWVTAEINFIMKVWMSIVQPEIWQVLGNPDWRDPACQQPVSSWEVKHSHLKNKIREQISISNILIWDKTSLGQTFIFRPNIIHILDQTSYGQTFTIDCNRYRLANQYVVFTDCKCFPKIFCVCQISWVLPSKWCLGIGSPRWKRGDNDIAVCGWDPSPTSSPTGKEVWFSPLTPVQVFRQPRNLIFHRFRFTDYLQ